MQVAIVEDDPLIAKAVSAAVVDAGHECRWISDGAQAGDESLLASDLVILDLMLPGIDGLTVLRGVVPRVVEFNFEHPERTVDAAVAQLLKDGALRRGNTVVVVTNMASGERIVDGVKIRTID